MMQFALTDIFKVIFLIITGILVLKPKWVKSFFVKEQEVTPTTIKRPKRSDDNELGAGNLATADLISPWFNKKVHLDTHLHVEGIKGANGVYSDFKILSIPIEERNRHILAIAKTGSGKTTKLILPILYHDCMCEHRSTIVIDSKPEMWRKLANMTRKYNPKKKILLFNPLDFHRSLSWNILSKIETDTDAKLIANTIIMATDNPQSKGDSPFFRNNALTLLNSIMVGLLSDPKEELSMPRIHELVQSGIQNLCNWFESHPKALRNTRTFVELARSGSQNADTIMSELAMRLSAWDLEAIRTTTAFNELDMEVLIKEPTLLIIEFRESELEMLRPLANVIVIELLRYLTKMAEKYPGTCLPRPVSLVIDEFASALGRLPDIHVKLNTLRSRNVSIVAAIQSIGQIKANYSQDADSVLAGFGTKIFMPALDVQDSEWASKETGNMTIRFQTTSVGSNRKIVEWFASKNKGSQEQVQQRPVLTPEEIGRPIDNCSTFFLPNTPPFQGFLVPYYKDNEIRARISEFDRSDIPELKLRSTEIRYEDKDTTVPGAVDKTYDNSTIVELKEKCKITFCSTPARKWWHSFEESNGEAVAKKILIELSKKNRSIEQLYTIIINKNPESMQSAIDFL